MARIQVLAVVAGVLLKFCFLVFDLIIVCSMSQHLLCFRSVQTHASVPADQRELLGITDNLIRLSVGLEDVEDLINDIDVALKVAVS